MSHPGRSRARSFGSQRSTQGRRFSRDDEEPGRSYGGAGHGREIRSEPRRSSYSGESGEHSGQSSSRTYHTTYPESEQFEVIRPSDIPAGESGKKVTLLANYFKMTVEPIAVYHYNIEFQFKNEEDKVQFADNERFQKYFSDAAYTIFEKFIQINVEYFGDFRFVYDNGRNLYCSKNLETLPMQKEIEVEFRGKKKYLVDLRIVQKVDFSLIEKYYQKKLNTIPDVPLHCLQLMLHNVNVSGFFLYKHKFFEARNLVRSPKEWIKFSPGFTDAIRFTEIGPALNIHLKTSCVISPSVEKLEQLILHFTGGRDLSEITDGEIEQVNNFIRGLKIFTEHTGRKAVYHIRGLDKPPKECFFLWKNIDPPRRVSVHEYFLEKYSLKLENYPTVEVIGKRNHLIPLELCLMVETQFLNNSKIDLNIQNDLLLASTHKPITYINNVTQYAEKIKTIDKELMTKNFGTDFVPKPIRFYGRVLDSPKQKGALRNDHFAQTPSRPSYAFFSFDIAFDRSEIDRVIADLQRYGSRFGMDLFDCVERVVVPINHRNLDQVVNIFMNILKYHPNLKLLFVVLPQINVLYNIVKHLGDQKYGLVTQCLDSVRCKSRRGGYIENVLLKINGKLGGKNSIILDEEFQRLSFDYTKTMVIGIDVNHPGQTEKIESSIACAVGSYDRNFTLFSASIHVQKKNRTEIIDCLEPMVIELMEEYRKHNGYFPQNVFAFRDGVSDGQFQYAENEVKQLRDGIRKCEKNAKLVYIVTQKGHHTRFVLAEPGQDNRGSYNVPAGTIVDSTIVEPSQHMFFLNSHFSPLGTSKPMKYVVLHNDFERRQMTNDDLQRFCFYCCHNCTRFRGTIALPTPVRYADLCAYRSKLHLEVRTASERIRIGDDNIENFELRVIAQLNNWVKVNENVKNALYYC